MLSTLNLLLDHRKLIAGTMAACMVLGAAYALLSTPVYEANVLVQVEEASRGKTGVLGEAGALLNSSSVSPAATEMEILRSRLVVGQAVENLRLDLFFWPKYVPWIGAWQARRASGPSTPGFLGMDGYVMGTESLDVAEFEVPPRYEGKTFTLRVLSTGFLLLDAEGRAVVHGRRGETENFHLEGQPAKIRVTDIVGKPGAEFFIVRTSRLRAMQALQDALQISVQGKNTGVYSISLEHSDPQHTAAVLNEIANELVRQNIEYKSAEVANSLRFVESQLPTLQHQVEESESRLNTFRRQAGVFELSQEANELLNRSSSIQLRLVELLQKRQEMAVNMTDEHPSMQKINSQIRSLNEELGRLGGRERTLPDTEQDLLRLRREAKVNGELYSSLLNSYQQLRLAKESAVGDVRIIDSAAVPDTPIKPRRLMILVLSAISGLGLGTGLAMLLGRVRGALRDPAEIERAGLTIFSEVPYSSQQFEADKQLRTKHGSLHVLSKISPQDPAVESLRSLRATLQYALRSSVNNIVLITSPMPGVGKSFTCVNLAAVLGAANKRILLIDGDMRSGHINRYFRVSRRGGLSDVLAGTLSFDEAVRRDILPKVDLLTTGELPAHPAELLLAHDVGALLRKLSSRYDMVLVDSPPVLLVSDANSLAPLAGIKLLVARAGQTSLRDLQESAKRLGQTGSQVNGVIFNALQDRNRRYYLNGGRYGVSDLGRNKGRAT